MLAKMVWRSSILLAIGWLHFHFCDHIIKFPFLQNVKCLIPYLVPRSLSNFMYRFYIVIKNYVRNLELYIFL